MCAIHRQVFWLRRQTRPPPSQSLRSSDILGFASPIQQRLCAGFPPGFPLPVKHLCTTYDSVVSLACFYYSGQEPPCQYAPNEIPPLPSFLNGRGGYAPEERTYCQSAG